MGAICNLACLKFTPAWWVGHLLQRYLLKTPHIYLHSFDLKVDNLYLVNTLLIRTPIFEWYVVWCGSKNKSQKEMCLEEVGLCAQNMITIIGST